MNVLFHFTVAALQILLLLGYTEKQISTKLPDHLLYETQTKEKS